MNNRHHTYKKKKENIIRDSPPLHHDYHPQPKFFTDMVQTSLHKDARQYRKKSYGSLEQCLGKANRTKHNKFSFCLYSINQLFLIQEKKYFEKIYLTKNKKNKKT